MEITSLRVGAGERIVRGKGAKLKKSFTDACVSVVIPSHANVRLHNKLSEKTTIKELRT